MSATTIIQTLSTRKTAMKVEELSTLLNCSPGKLYTLAKRNRIPHLKMGAMLRFDPGAIAAWLEDKSSV